MIEISPYSVLWTYIVTIIYVVLISLIIKISNKTKATLLPIVISVPVTLIILFHIFIPVEFVQISKTYTDYIVFPLIVDFLLYPILYIKGHTILNVMTLILIALTIKVLREIKTPLGKIHSIMLSRKRINDPSPHIEEILDFVKNKYGFRFKTKLICNEQVTEISEFGLFFQVIYLDNRDYTDKELQYIFLHELTHFKYGTNWLKMFLNIALVLFCWIPESAYYAEYFNDCIETFVDKKAVSLLSEHEKVEYCRCLLKASENISPSKYKGNSLTTSFVSRNEKMIDCRIKSIITNTDESKKYKVNIPMCLSITLLTVVYVFVSYNYIVQPGWQPVGSDTSDLSGIFTPDNSYITMENGKFMLYYNGELFLGDIDPDAYPDLPIK